MHGHQEEGHGGEQAELALDGMRVLVLKAIKEERGEKPEEEPGIDDLFERGVGDGPNAQIDQEEAKEAQRDADRKQDIELAIDNLLACPEKGGRDLEPIKEKKPQCPSEHKGILSLVAEPLKKQEQAGDGTARKDEKGKIENRARKYWSVLSAYHLSPICL